ncbi:hypothetical protein C8Q73DRAFT_511362 [Cubamyces lactineus]|nr:hypothetical protein C8Q73DRAFT_511362 [Cubamyces lactineus]
MSSVPAITFRQLSRWSLVVAVRCCSPRQVGRMMYRQHLVLVLLAPRRGAKAISGRDVLMMYDSPPMDASLFLGGVRGCRRVGMGVRACVRAEAVPSQLHHRPCELSFHPLRDPIRPPAVGHCLMTICCLPPFHRFVSVAPRSSPQPSPHPYSRFYPPARTSPHLFLGNGRVASLAFVLHILLPSFASAYSPCVSAVSLLPSSASAPAVPCVYLSLSSL